MIGGIKISEANLLAHTTVMSCIFLLTVLLAIWALIVFCKGNDKENKERIQKLKKRAETDPSVLKQLKNLKNRYQKNKRKILISGLLVESVLVILILVNLFLAVIPGWTDFVKKDYVVYEGEFEVYNYTREHYIILGDGTRLKGALGLDSGVYTDKIVYSPRSKFALGK